MLGSASCCTIEIAARENGLLQSTIERAVSCSGSGLHSGKPVRLRLEPADLEHGLVFYLNTGAESGPIPVPAHSDFLAPASRASILEREDAEGRRVTVATVEHLLATLMARSIQHAKIFVDGSELPALDGSAREFLGLVTSAGRRGLGADLVPVELASVIEIREGDRLIRAEPAAKFGIDVGIDFAHPAIGEQSLVIGEFDEASFAREIAGARTFGFLGEVEALRAENLAFGASLDNTIVVDDEGVMNPDGLRFPDEFVRHKALDLLGDLALIGRPLKARVTVRRGGHQLHHALVRAIVAEFGIPSAR